MRGNVFCRENGGESKRLREKEERAGEGKKRETEQ